MEIDTCYQVCFSMFKKTPKQFVYLFLLLPWLQAGRDAGTKGTVTQRPEVVDDFVRNFLVRMGLHKSLDCFQTEWYVLLSVHLTLIVVEISVHF